MKISKGIYLCVLSMIFLIVFNLSSQSKAGIKKSVKAGALIHITGIWSELGKEQKATLDLALEQVNFYLAKSGLELELIIEDSESDSRLIVSKLQSLKQQGVDVVIGPFSSAEVAGAVEFANNNNMLLISPSSTAPSLAMNDNLIRLAPNDKNQGRAMAMLLESDRIKSVIPVYLDDIYGNGLFEALNSSFTGNDQTVFDGIAFDPLNPDYDIILQSIETELKQGLENNETGTTTAVYLVSTASQAVELFNKIPEQSSLLDVNWYASDSLTGSEFLLNNKIAAEAASRTNLTGITLSTHDIYFYIYSWLIMQMIEDEIGYRPLPTVLTTWDALWLIAETFRSTSTNRFSELRESLISLSTDYFGAYGFGGLDENGDKVEARYNIVSIESGITGFENDVEKEIKWKVSGSYIDMHYWEPALNRFFDRRDITEEKMKIDIGALLDLSGALSAQGQINREALKLALTHINKYFNAKDSGLSIAIETFDTMTDPEIAQKKMQLLNNNGIKVVVGPSTSSATEAIDLTIKESGQSVISPSSTAPSLARKDDQIMRLVPTDMHQGKAIAELITSQGIKTVFAVYRDDIYGNELLEAFGNEFSGNIKSAINYDTSKRVFGSLIQKLNDRVERYLVRKDAESTAILVIGFEEVIDMFRHFDSESALAQVRWYGTDGIALNSELIHNRKAAIMAEAVSLTCSVYDLNALGLFLPQIETLNFFLESVIGEEVSAITANMYDALWIAALGYERAGLIMTEPDELWSNLNGGANWTYGMSTPLFLDINSDRIDASYGFYTISSKNLNHVWKLVATYRNTEFSTSGISLIE